MCGPGHWENMEECKNQLPKEDPDKIRENIAKLREKLAKKDEQTPESIKETTGKVQKLALKLFETRMVLATAVN